MEFLNIVWFILIMVLFTGFFVLEGFDYGVGMLTLGKSDIERSQIIRAIGPIWDANEVWMITAGGALFAAFPHAYATMFSTFYLALFLLLVALIFRAVAFELRGKYPAKKWRCAWDCAIFFGSAVPALLWGVAFGNLLQGLPIDQNLHYLGNFYDLLSPYTILTGITFLTLFLFHGANFLLIKLADGRLLLELKRQGFKCGIVAFAIYVIFVIVTAVSTNLVAKWIFASPLFIAAICLMTSVNSLYRDRFFSAFIFSTISIVGLTIGFFTALFPNIMVSSLDPNWSVNIYNAASTPHTLAIMTGAAVVLVPIVLIYQAWTYRIFKERISPSDVNH